MKRPSEKRDLASSFLLVTLSDGPMRATEIAVSAAALGHNKYTVDSASKAIGVVKWQCADGWMWQLPPPARETDSGINARPIRSMSDDDFQPTETEGHIPPDDAVGTCAGGKGSSLAAIGRRLTESRRELCRLSLNDAAQALGVSAAVLRQHENPTDKTQLSIPLLDRAARFYDVSMDYLFGHDDEWEKSTEATRQRMSRRCGGAHINAVVLESFGQLEAAANALEDSAGALAGYVKTVGAALEKMREANQKFDGLKAGAPLVSAVEKATDAAHAVIDIISRFPKQQP